MKKEDVIKIIEKIPNTKPYHSKSDEYKIKLTNNLISLTLNYSKLNEKIEDLLIGDNTSTSKSLFTYNQGISELLWWFFLDKKNLNYKIDVKMVEGKDTNIDVQFKSSNITYNIEIKSPEYPIMKEDTLHGRIEVRVPNVDMISILNEVSELFSNAIENSKYKKVEKVLPKENKIKDCLLSAQKKFVENSESNCNILFISTTTDELVSYIDYFVNPFSGFFTSSSYIEHSQFDKVKAVILSNAISMNENEVGKGWDLSYATNLIFNNPFCKYKDNHVLDNILNLLPNVTREYHLEQIKFNKEQSQKKEELRLPYLTFLLEFVHKYRK
jgi:hypothetical protein